MRDESATPPPGRIQNDLINPRTTPRISTWEAWNSIGDIVEFAGTNFTCAPLW